MCFLSLTSKTDDNTKRYAMQQDTHLHNSTISSQLTQCFFLINESKGNMYNIEGDSIIQLHLCNKYLRGNT